MSRLWRALDNLLLQQNRALTRGLSQDALYVQGLEYTHWPSAILEFTVMRNLLLRSFPLSFFNEI